MGIVLTEEDTLSAESESLRKESSILASLVYVELAVGVALVGWGGIYYILSDGFGWLIFGGVALFFALSHYIKSKQNKADAAKFEHGKSGEEFVTEILENDLPDSCLILNDLEVQPRDRPAQMDHVVVCPAGLFVIETKAYGGRLEGHAEDEKWIQHKEYQGNKQKNKLTNPIQQNEYHVEILLEFLRDNELPFREQHVHSLVAMVNKQMESNVEGDTSNVDFAWYITKRIQPQLEEPNYDVSEIKQLLNKLDLELPEEFSVPDRPTPAQGETSGSDDTAEESDEAPEESAPTGSTPDVEDLKLD